MTLNAGNDPLSAYALHNGTMTTCRCRMLYPFYGDKYIYAACGPLLWTAAAGQFSSYGGYCMTLAAPYLGELGASAMRAWRAQAPSSSLRP